MAKGEPIDLISRQAAIDEIKNYDPSQIWDTADVEVWVNALPSAQQWIPCSERPPKVREWVLCQCRAGIMDVLRLTEDGDWNKDYPHTEYMRNFVIAWMPLPEAYKGEDHETD